MRRISRETARVEITNNCSISIYLNAGWGARIRTWDDGTKARCLTAWPRPNFRLGDVPGIRLFAPWPPAITH